MATNAAYQRHAAGVITVFRTAEAIALFGANAVRRNRRRRLWQWPELGVAVTHNGPLTRSEQQEVVLCMSPPAAALGGLTALEREGFTGFDQSSTFIVLPEGARRPDASDAEFHWSTRLDDEDIHPLRSPRRTRPARALVDAASWCGSDRLARTLVIAAFQQRLVSARTVRLALARRGRCRRRALIVESVLDASGGIQSIPERDFDEIRRSCGLPPPSRQSKIKGADGRYYLDVEWKLWRIAVEVHGVGHLKVDRWDADLRRSNEVIIGGRSLLAFSSYVIRHEPSSVADQLLRMFAASGWTKDDASQPTSGRRAS